MGRLFKNKIIAIWYIAGFMVLFILFLYIADSDIIRKREMEKHNELLATGGVRFSVILEVADADNLSESKEMLLKEFKMYDMAVESDAFPYVYPQFKDMKGASVYLTSAIVEYPLYKGTYPTKEQLSGGGNYAVISYSQKDDVYKEDGKDKIDINGISFEVTGYLSKYAEWMVVDKTILFSTQDAVNWNWFTLNQTGRFGITVSGDNVDELTELNQRASEMIDEVLDDGFVIKNVSPISPCAPATDVSSEFSRVPSENQIRYVAYMCIFVIIMILIITWYWTRLRNKEFSILRKNGLSDIRILAMVQLEVLIYSSVGTATGGAIRLIMIHVFDGYIDTDVKYAYSYFSIAVLYILASVLITSVFVFIRLVMSRFTGEKNEGIKKI